MGRVQATSMIFQDRPLLGQMAIATVLVGSVAALSSAVIAVPVSQVGYAEGWDERAPAVPQLAVASVIAKAPPSQQFSAPLQVATPVRASAPPPRTAHELSPRQAPMTRIESAQLPHLVTPGTSRIISTPRLAELAPLPVEAPAAALVNLPEPVVAAGAVPASLAIGALVPAVEAALPGEAAKAVEPVVPLRLINPPELRSFDLARMSATPRSVPAGFASPATRSASSGKVEGLGKKDSVVGEAVFHQVTVMVAGSDGKAIDVRIGADMKPSIKVGDLLGLVSDRMDPDSAARFAAASSAGDYVSLATLREAGFVVAYNAGADSISINVGP